MERPTPASWRTDGRHARLVQVGAVLVLSCSTAAPPAQTDEPMPAQTPARATLAARDLIGYWKWALVSEDDGVRRVETETWHFTRKASASAGRLTGTCERSVTFMSLDGVPFACNQGLHYRLNASYRVEVAMNDDLRRAIVSELDYQVAPSPCERGQRQVTRYDAQLTDSGQLHLRWSDGQQYLQRIQAPTVAPSPAQARASEQNTVPGLTGSWSWHSRNQKNDEVRVESEIWQLDEDPSTGTVVGTFARQVTIFAEGGARYECANDTYYQYRDTYTVRGSRRGTEISLSETAVTPEQHPCLIYPKRHLDAAVGRLTGEYLTLTWRGGKRQVLRRAPATSQ